MYYGSYTSIHIVKSRIAKWDRVCGIAGYIAVTMEQKVNLSYAIGDNTVYKYVRKEKSSERDIHRKK